VLEVHRELAICIHDPGTICAEAVKVVSVELARAGVALGFTKVRDSAARG